MEQFGGGGTHTTGLVMRSVCFGETRSTSETTTTTTTSTASSPNDAAEQTFVAQTCNVTAAHDVSNATTIATATGHHEQQQQQQALLDFYAQHGLDRSALRFLWSGTARADKNKNNNNKNDNNEDPNDTNAFSDPTTPPLLPLPLYRFVRLNPRFDPAESLAMLQVSRHVTSRRVTPTNKGGCDHSQESKWTSNDTLLTEHASRLSAAHSLFDTWACFRQN